MIHIPRPTSYQSTKLDNMVKFYVPTWSIFAGPVAIYQLLVIQNTQSIVNRELTVSDNNLHIKPTVAIGFTVCLLL